MTKTQSVVHSQTLLSLFVRGELKCILGWAWGMITVLYDRLQRYWQQSVQQLYVLEEYIAKWQRKNWLKHEAKRESLTLSGIQCLRLLDSSSGQFSFSMLQVVKGQAIPTTAKLERHDTRWKNAGHVDDSQDTKHTRRSRACQQTKSSKMQWTKRMHERVQQSYDTRKTLHHNKQMNTKQWLPLGLRIAPI